MNDWRGKRVTVMGLGRFGGGVGVTRWLVEVGACVRVTDLAPAEELRDSLDAIADLGVELRLGGHDAADFRDADAVVVSPAVSETSDFLAIARQAGVAITTEINLFVQRCPARCVGVTGSVGKSTTTAMVGHVLERTLTGRRVWVGGNLGRSLLADLPHIRADDLVVLELSSFQLLRTPAVGWSPHIAVLTNLAPNHLDWHGTFEAYVAAKRNIAAFQNSLRDFIVAPHDPAFARLFDATGKLRPRTWRFGLADGTPFARPADGTPQAVATREIRWPELRLHVPGLHNRLNAAAALAAAHLLGVEPLAAARALASFAGLPHRLELVAESAGVRYYNDSKATTPDATLTALDAIESPVLVILGGYDKKLDLRPVVRAAAERARFSACMGQTGAGLCDAIRAAGGQAEFFESLEAAVAACRRRARSGDAVLLSPACASWDMFLDYRARGEAFARAAGRLAT